MKHINRKKAQNILEKLQGKECRALLFGPPMGGIITLYLGELTKREKPLENRKLPAEIREYSSEYRLCIQCDWRLQNQIGPVTGFSESNIKNGPLEKGLRKLKGQKVENIQINDICGDLEIFFGELKLKVFCNYTGHADNSYSFQENNNWYLFRKDIITLEVKQGCEIVIPETGEKVHTEISTENLLALSTNQALTTMEELNDTERFLLLSQLHEIFKTLMIMQNSIS